MVVVIESGHPKACLLPDAYHIYKGGSDFHGLKTISARAIQVFHLNDYPADPPREKASDKDRIYPGDGIAPLVQDLVEDLQALVGQAHFAEHVVDGAGVELLEAGAELLQGKLPVPLYNLFSRGRGKRVHRQDPFRNFPEEKERGISLLMAGLHILGKHGFYLDPRNFSQLSRKSSYLVRIAVNDEGDEMDPFFPEGKSHTSENERAESRKNGIEFGNVFPAFQHDGDNSQSPFNQNRPPLDEIWKCIFL